MHFIYSLAIHVILHLSHFHITEDKNNCKEGDVTYLDSDIWKPEPCRLCVCDKGRVFCEEIRCEDLKGCEQLTIPEGECCPVCEKFASAQGRIGEWHLSFPLEGSIGLSFILSMRKIKHTIPGPNTWHVLLRVGDIKPQDFFMLHNT